MSANATAALLNRADLAGMLQVSLRQLDRLDASGKLPQSIRIGTRPRWSREEIEAWIKAGCPCRAAWNELRNR